MHLLRRILFPLCLFKKFISAFFLQLTPTTTTSPYPATCRKEARRSLLFQRNNDEYEKGGKENSNSGRHQEGGYGGELVGATGRIGSFLFRAITSKQQNLHNNTTTLDKDATSSSKNTTTKDYDNNSNLVKLSRAEGISPGLSSPPNTPIYVAIPATEVRSGM